MTKFELINAVNSAAEEKGIDITKKDTGDLIDAIFEVVSQAVKDEGRFSYPNFGTFTVKERKARQGRNPRTGDVIEIPASKTVNFKPAPTLKDLLND